jgi:hypothetical protein
VWTSRFACANCDGALVAKIDQVFLKATDYSPIK